MKLYTFESTLYGQRALSKTQKERNKGFGKVESMRKGKEKESR
jgi:hypothetical protein